MSRVFGKIYWRELGFFDRSECPCCGGSNLAPGRVFVLEHVTRGTKEICEACIEEMGAAFGEYKIKFSVVAYDESGYGDNRSQVFNNGYEAVEYARSLEPRFGATVWKITSTEPVHTQIWPEPTDLKENNDNS